MAPLSGPAVEALRGPVMSILRKSDLTSISAKKVRTALVNTPADAMQGDVGSDVAGPRLLPRLGIDITDKSHKEAVDELVKACFDEINGANPAPTTSLKDLSYGTNGDGDRHSNGASAAATPKLALPGMGGVRGSHTDPKPSAAAPSSSQSSGKKRSRKDDDQVISDEEDADAETISKVAKKSKAKATKKKKSAKTGADGEKGKRAPNPNNPFNKPVVLSDEMSQVCGAKEMPRYMITKQLWAYIKGKDLQDPSNKRKILCDATLKKLFGKAEVDSFEMAKLISPHVSKKVES